METHEYEDDTIPHAILAHQRQVVVEKATNVIIQAEEQDSYVDRRNELYRDIEA